MPELPRTVHRDAAGHPLFSYVAASDHGRRAAYDVAVIGADQRAAAAVLADLSGWTVSGAAGLGDALVAAGAHERRRFHVMHRELADLSPGWATADLGPGRRAVPVDRDAEDLAGPWRAAYPSDHPDRHTGTDAEAVAERLIPLLAGDEGAVLQCSRLALDPDDRVVGGVVVIDVDGLGPLIGDVFRAPGPEYAGLGTALLKRSLSAAATAGVPSIGLSVTDANPARKVYQRLGFAIASSMVTVIVP